MATTVVEAPIARPRGVGRPSRRPTSPLEHLKTQRAQLRAEVRKQDPLRVIADPNASDERKTRAFEMFDRFQDLDSRLTKEIRDLSLDDLLLDEARAPKADSVSEEEREENLRRFREAQQKVEHERRRRFETSNSRLAILARKIRDGGSVGNLKKPPTPRARAPRHVAGTFSTTTSRPVASAAASSGDSSSAGSPDDPAHSGDGSREQHQLDHIVTAAVSR
jgi:hypothetical protein